MKLKDFTLGVEEEYQIIDPQTRELAGRATPIIKSARQKVGDDAVQPEIHRSQVEIVSSICHSLEEVRSEVSRLRGSVIEAAAQDGKKLAAAGTHPFSDWKQQSITEKERYQGLIQVFQQESGNW